MIDESVVPIPKTNVDIVALSPSAEQYFLFSRVDGKLTVEQMCQTSGLGRETTLEGLRFLAGAGAIEIPGFEASSSPTPTSKTASAQTRPDGAQDLPSGATAAKDEAATQPDKPSGKASVSPNYPIPPQDFDFDPELLALETPLQDSVRLELICLYEQLSEMSYYDLFGLSMGAKRKEIKRAYFRLSKRHHPDKFFRQDLGVLGSMQETVFREIARAYTTLSKKSSRKEYDTALSAHLSEQEGSRRGSTASTKADAMEQEDTQEALRERNKRKAAATLLVRRAEKYEARGQYGEAAEEYRKALALTREPELALRVATLMLNTAKMPKEAACFARAALKLGAPMASARYILGRAMQAAGAEQAAIQEFQKVLADSPEHPGARAGLGELEGS